MRYTDDGYISTEVELPPPGARVEYKYVGYIHAKPGEATFDGTHFVFDNPYRSHRQLGSFHGYWRYLDTPDEEKRDSGQRRAFTEPSVEALEARIRELEFVDDLAIDADEMLLDRIEAIEEVLQQRTELLRELESRLADRAKTSQLEKEGWISAEKEMPKDNYHSDYEVMKDGKNLGKAHAFTDRWTRRWTIGSPITTLLGSTVIARTILTEPLGNR